MNDWSQDSLSRFGRLVAVTAVAGLALTACGDKKEDKPATQTAVKVNKEEITVHQINALLQQQRALKPEQAEAASKAVLERLIDQELAVQKASELKVDRDARVVQQLDAARREIIARAYLQKLGEGASKPSPEEVKKYYDENPNLFSARRVYQLQEIVIEAPPEVIAQLTEKLKSSKTTTDFVDYLKAQQIKYTANQGARGAEQLPMASLGAFASMKDGDARISTTPTGGQVLSLVASRSQPVDLERARPVIEAFLINERRRKIIADDMKAMRAAANIQYVGKYAPAASASAGEQPKAVEAAAPAPVTVLEPASSPASGSVDASTINKGLGLK